MAQRGNDSRKKETAAIILYFIISQCIQITKIIKISHTDTTRIELSNRDVGNL